MAGELRVVIPTSGGSATLVRTLASLAKCLRPSIYNETIVIENGPPRSAEAAVTKYAAQLQARYLHVKTCGKNNALNKTLERLDDECLVVFSDDDVRFCEHHLIHYAEAAEGFDSGRYFGGPTGVDYEEPPPEWLMRYLPASAAGWHPNDPGHSMGEGMFLGFNWSAFVGDIRRAGMFDPRLGPGTPAGGGDETDMQKRLQAIGVEPQYLPGAMVWHYVPKKRCSQSWAVQRWYRTSISDGHAHQIDYEGKFLFGVPRYKYRKLLRHWWRYILTRFCRDEEVRFQARYDLARFAGLLKGMRQAYNEGLSRTSR